MTRPCPAQRPYVRNSGERDSKSGNDPETFGKIKGQVEVPEDVIGEEEDHLDHTHAHLPWELWRSELLTTVSKSYDTLKRLCGSDLKLITV
jgi:hypothetical protein